MMFRIALIALVVLTLSTMVAYTQEITHRVEMEPGRAVLWRDGGQVKNTIIGDVSVADALPGMTSDELVLVSKKPGATNFLVLADDGSVVANIAVVVTDPKQDPYRIHIHSKAGNLQGYWAYSCKPGEACHRVEDAMEGSEHFPAPPTNVTIRTGPTFNTSAPSPQ